jgi:hypothetical protein
VILLDLRRPQNAPNRWGHFVKGSELAGDSWLCTACWPLKRRRGIRTPDPSITRWVRVSFRVVPLGVKSLQTRRFVRLAMTAMYPSKRGLRTQ